MHDPERDHRQVAGLGPRMIMQRTDVPICLNRAREEILLALSSPTAHDAEEHKKLADALIIEAVREIDREPERARDWSMLGA